MVFLPKYGQTITPPYSEVSPTSAVIYQLQFKKKTETTKGHKFERLTELIERLVKIAELGQKAKELGKMLYFVGFVGFVFQKLLIVTSFQVQLQLIQHTLHWTREWYLQTSHRFQNDQETQPLSRL